MTLDVHILRRSAAPLAEVLFTVICSGCFREVTLDPGILSESTREAIVVVTIDGWRYKFESGAYSLTSDSTGVQVLTGKGRRYRGSDARFTEFQGSLMLSQIEKITVSETTPWLYVSIGVMVLFFLSIIWAPNAFSKLS